MPASILKSRLFSILVPRTSLCFKATQTTGGELLKISVLTKTRQP